VTGCFLHWIDTAEKDFECLLGSIVVWSSLAIAFFNSIDQNESRASSPAATGAPQKPVLSAWRIKENTIETII
jgi:hypothetical protein